MLDLCYKSVDAFKIDCDLCGYNAEQLLRDKCYAILSDGYVLAQS
jgi:hypothetical protein